MISSRKITDDIVYVGVDDSITRFFEGTWPIPNGISYNTFLIKDKKNVLVEGGVKKYFAWDFMSELKRHVDLKDLDYIIVNHSEPDHTGSLPLLLELTDAKVIASKFGAMLLKNFYGIPQDRFEIVGTGDSLDIGSRELQFVLTPGAHWPDAMVTYDPINKVVFSSDIFGSYGMLRGSVFDFEADLEYFLGEAKRYFVNIIGKFVANAKRALNALSSLNIEVVAPAHGVIWGKHKEKVFDLYDRLVNLKPEPRKVSILYGSMYGFSERIAYLLANKLTEKKLKVNVIDVTLTHPSYTLSEIWDSEVIILGSPTYDNGAFPPMLMHVTFFQIKAIKNKKYAIFGSSGWSGGGYKELIRILDSLNWSLIEPIVEYRGEAKEDTIKKIDALVNNILNSLE